MNNFLYFNFGFVCIAFGLFTNTLNAQEKDLKKVNSITTKPNILIIYSDDQGTLDAGCYGSTDIKTPVLDKLASQGVRFTQAYAHTVCCPSRAALITGRAPQRGGVNDWTSCNPNDKEGRVLDLKEITIAEHLKKFGYKTGIIGKWHLGATLDHGPLEQGFDEFYGFRGGFIDYYSHQFLHASASKPPFHDLYRGNKEIFENGKYFPDLQVREACSFLERHQKEPFFLYLPFNLPHYPEQPDSTFVEEYKDLKWPRNLYAPMVATFDNRMGQVLDKLDNLGLRENTIIIFMSDNGHSTEDYYNWDVSYGANGGGGYTGKWRGAKGSFLEGGIRVPAIMSYPKVIPKGIIRNQVIVNTDIFPTLCELINIPFPEKKLDGFSILNIIKSEKSPSAHTVLNWMWQDMWAIRKDKWKLIYKGHDTTGKFSLHPENKFDMPEYFLANLEELNPEEKNHSSEHPEIVKELLKIHNTWAIEVFKDSGYEMPNKNNSKTINNVKGTKRL